jgi:hypothetical protein
MDKVAGTAGAIASHANYPAVLVAGIAGFLVGWLWYTIFGKAWQRGIGESHRPRSRVLLYITAFVANVVMAAMLQGVLVHSGLWGVKDGIISGCFLWVGFVVTALGVAESFQGRPASVMAIDCGHWLAVLIVIGAIIGAFGPV